MKHFSREMFVPIQSCTQSSSLLDSLICSSPSKWLPITAGTDKYFWIHILGPKDSKKFYNSEAICWKIQLIFKWKIVVFCTKRKQGSILKFKIPTFFPRPQSLAHLFCVEQFPQATNPQLWHNPNSAPRLSQLVMGLCAQQMFAVFCWECYPRSQ